MKDITQLLEEADATIAIVGATDDQNKYGNVIYRDLKKKGFAIFPVNPGHATIDGDRCYASLDDLPVPPSIVNIVTPPKVTNKILRECLRLNYKNIWVQPGAEDADSLTFLQENSFNYLARACIMTRSRQAGS